MTTTEHAAEVAPVPVTGTVKIDGGVPTVAKAADFGAYTTYTLAATTTAQKILPHDTARSRAVLIVSGTGPVYVGSQGQTQASPVLGGQLPTGAVVEIKNKQELWLAPDGTHTATVTVVIERWSD